MVIRSSNLFLLLPALILGACSGKPVKKPNFLILIADDQRWDQLSCADHPIIPELKTPNIDRLASNGVYYRNAFVTSPICAVSRASIMTGRYASSHGMNHFNTPLAPEVLAKTYPALLHDHGYTTAVLGKWGMGTEGTGDVFDLFNAWADQGRYFHDTDSGKVHNEEWLAAKARDFLKSRNPDKPFCLTVCFKAPHHPYQPDERDKDLFGEVKIPKRATDTPEGYRAMSATIMDSSLNRWCYFDERKDEATKDKFEKNFLRCVASLDRAIGEIAQSLVDLKLDKNTVIIYLSDNGYLWGEHGLGGKWVLYEESIRVPIIIDIPDISRRMKGKRADNMVLNIDIAPTILEMAGIDVPAEMDGISQLPFLLGKKSPSRKDFFMEHVGVIDVETPIPDSRGVRTNEWKYIRYVNIEPEVEELYRISQDPKETENQADNNKYLAVKRDLIQKYDSYLKRLSR